MYDASYVNAKFKEPLLLLGRFKGAGTDAPTAITGTSKGLTIARSDVGALTLTVSDVPVGVNQAFRAAVNSGTTSKAVLVTPIGTSFVSPYTVALQVCYTANSAAVDLATTEELQIEAWFSRSSGT